MKPKFMSLEHIMQMNRAIEESDEVRAACRNLGRSATVHYRLTDGPGGEVDWTVELTPDGLKFGLDRPERASVVIETGYASMVNMARAARQDNNPPVAAPPVISGDISLLTDLGPILALARRVATVDVEFPDL